MTQVQQKQETTQTFSCSGCGGRPVWDPESGKLKCPYCGHFTDVTADETKPEEYPLEAAPTAAQQDWGEKKRVVRCQGCGAETVLGAEETATLCPFCGSPHVLEDQAAAGIAPESVLPFKIPQKAAVSAFRKWLKKRWFAPGKAKKMATLGQISGVYLPHWTYDSDTTSTYVGEAGHHYYVQVPVTVERDGKQETEMREEQRTRWEPVSGVVQHDFDDVVVPGSERLPENLLERVQPYDLSKLCRYQAAFLSGFISEKPAVDVHKGWEGAKKRIDSQMEELAMEDILADADEARVNSLKSTYREVKYKLTLLPMYLSSFTYKNKAYHVLVNGENGRCGGEAPVSPWRVALAVLVGILVCVGLYYVLE